MVLHKVGWQSGLVTILVQAEDHSYGAGTESVLPEVFDCDDLGLETHALLYFGFLHEEGKFGHECFALLCSLGL